MPSMSTYIRNGRGAVRPYVYGPPELLDMVQRAFGAEVVERSPDGSEIEVRVDDSMLSLSLHEHHPTESRGSIRVFVADVDAACERAREAGGTVIAEPVDKPYHERMAGVRDTFGNTWWISTYVGDA
jgi:PhnB protein